MFPFGVWVLVAVWLSSINDMQNRSLKSCKNQTLALNLQEEEEGGGEADAKEEEEGSESKK